MLARRDVPLTCSRQLLAAMLGGLLLPVALFIVLLALLQSAPVLAQTGVIFVDADASGAATGDSWTDAFTTLQDALAGAPSGAEIWVAEGVYYPDEGAGQTPDDQTSTFQLLDDVAIYGGFAATETVRTERDWANNLTVLSGDIDGNDANGDGNHVAESADDIRGDNATHVVIGSGTDRSAVLDGFTVTAGNDDDGWVSTCGTGCGGGLYNEGGSPTLTNLTFSGNDTDNSGGGMFNYGGSPTLVNVTFSGNRAAFVVGGDGGGMANENGSSPTLIDVTFSGNFASGSGGGMHNDASSPTITNTTFSTNSAYGNGGGMFNTNNSNPTLTSVTFSGNFAHFGGSGGGMLNYSSSPTLTEVTFSGNEAEYGGGLGNVNGSSPTLIDVTFDNNQARSNGGAVSNSGSSPTVTNAAFRDNDAGDFGGAIFNALESNPTITNAIFTGNEGERYGGAVYNTQSHPTLTNVVFRGNRADDRGGGLYNVDSDPTLINATFSGNSAEIGSSLPAGGALYNDRSSPTIQNSIIWNNQNNSDTDTANASIADENGSATTISYSLVQGWNPAGAGNLDGTDSSNDPLFVTPVAPADAPTTAGDLRLLPGSPAIDAGENDPVPAGLTTDLDGNARLRDGDNDGVQTVDMGAYEFTSPVVAVGLAPLNVVESSDQAMAASFTRTANTSEVLTITFDVGGSATVGADYTLTGADSYDASSGTVVFGAGVVSRTVLMTPTADLIAEQDETITFSLSATSSYSVSVPATVTGTIVDDDSAGVPVHPTGDLETTEAGGTDTFTLTLQSEPTGAVTVTVVSDDATEGTVSPAALTFNNTNWQTPQTVTVTGVDDDVDDGDIAYTVETNVSSEDTFYDGIAADDVSVTNLDDDGVGVSIAPTGGLTTTEAGGTATFTVTLDSEPTGIVTVALNSDDPTEGAVEPTTLTFDATNWQMPQSAMVTGENDEEDDGDQSYSVVTSVSSDDPDYHGIVADNVNVTNLDNDYRGFLPLIFSPQPGPSDLVVEALSVTKGEVTVVIANAGESPVLAPFWVDVYINPDPAPTAPNQTWPMVADEGLVWGIEGDALPLESGETLALTIGDGYYAPALSNFGGALPAGTVLYAQADSAYVDNEHGAVLESHEATGGPYNNIVGPLIVPDVVTVQTEVVGPGRLPSSLPPRP